MGRYADLSSGASIGGFTIESRLGAGAMGAVYRATEEALGRTVAVKVLPPQLAWDDAFRERFIRESRTASAVDHPNIIPVYGAGEDDGILYLAMRYVPDGDLHTLLYESGPMSPEDAMALLAPVAAALDAAHRTGIVHRDLKPANILVDRTPGGGVHPYLSDFGLAREIQQPGMTAAGLFLGTAAYAAPEQLAGEPAGPRSDQYALASVAFQVLTGEMPFRGDTPVAQMLARRGGMPRASELRPGLPSMVDGVLIRGLAHDPSHRYATCTDLTEALSLALHGRADALGDPRLRPDAPAPRPRTRRWLTRLITIGAVLTVLGAAGFAGGVAAGEWPAPSWLEGSHPALPYADGVLSGLRTVRTHAGDGVTAVSLDPRGTTLTTLDSSGTLSTFAVGSGRRRSHRVLRDVISDLDVKAARFAGLDHVVVVPSFECEGAAAGRCDYRVFDVRTGAARRPIGGGSGPVLGLGNHLLAVVGPDHQGVDTWAAAGHRPHDKHLGAGLVRSVAVDPSGEALAIGTESPTGDAGIAWYAGLKHAPGQRPLLVTTVTTRTPGPRLGLTGQTLAAGDDEGTDVYRALPKRPDHWRTGHVNGTLLTVSPDNGNLVVTLDPDHRHVSLWDPRQLHPENPTFQDVTGTLTRVGRAGCGSATPTAASFGKAGRTLAVACSDGRVDLLRVRA